MYAIAYWNGHKWIAIAWRSSRASAEADKVLFQRHYAESLRVVNIEEEMVW